MDRQSVVESENELNEKMYRRELRSLIALNEKYKLKRDDLVMMYCAMRRMIYSTDSALEYLGETMRYERLKERILCAYKGESRSAAALE